MFEVVKKIERERERERAWFMIETAAIFIIHTLAAICQSCTATTLNIVYRSSSFKMTLMVQGNVPTQVDNSQVLCDHGCSITKLIHTYIYIMTTTTVKISQQEYWREHVGQANYDLIYKYNVITLF